MKALRNDRTSPAPCSDSLLNRCPFCGSTEHDRDPESDMAAIELQSCVCGELPKVFYVVCNVCGACGPLCDEGADALQRFFNPNTALAYEI